MYCSKCGIEIDDSSSFCSHCGTSTNAGSNHGYSTYQEPGGDYRFQGYPHPYTEKSAGLAAVLSFLIIGGGHIYVGLVSKGVMFLVIAVVLTVLTFLTLFFGLALLGLWIWGMYDSYNSAVEYNRCVMQRGNPPW